MVEFELIETVMEFPSSETWKLKSGKQEYELILKQVKTFPDEWLLLLENIQEDLIPSILEFSQERVQLANGKWLVFRYDEDSKINSSILDNFYRFGFKVYFTDVNSILDLGKIKGMKSTIALGGGQLLIEQLYGGSIELVDHFESNNTKWKELYDLECETSDDIPSRTGFRHPTFNEYKLRFLKEEASAKSIFIAIYNDQFIGLAYSWVEGKKAGIFYTGVKRKFRGIGIGTLLKISLANYLKGIGIKSLFTNNKEINHPIIRTNEKIGFQLISKTHYLRKSLN